MWGSGGVDEWRNVCGEGDKPPMQYDANGNSFDKPFTVSVNRNKDKDFSRGNTNYFGIFFFNIGWFG